VRAAAPHQAPLPYRRLALLEAASRRERACSGGACAGGAELSGVDDTGVDDARVDDARVNLAGELRFVSSRGASGAAAPATAPTTHAFASATSSAAITGTALKSVASRTAADFACLSSRRSEGASRAALATGSDCKPAGRRPCRSLPRRGGENQGLASTVAARGVPTSSKGLAPGPSCSRPSAPPDIENARLACLCRVSRSSPRRGGSGQHFVCARTHSCGVPRTSLETLVVRGVEGELNKGVVRRALLLGKTPVDRSR